MKTTVNSTATIKNIAPAQVFPVANKIRKVQGCTMKEAYAKFLKIPIESLDDPEIFLISTIS